MLPEAERVEFRNPPLQLVIGQVRFPVMPRFSESSLIAQFHEAIRSDYPRSAREQQMLLQLSPQGVQPESGQIVWRFKTRDDRWAVVLGETAVTLEARGYSSIDEFLTRFETILSVVRDELEVTDLTRLGLRYINEIRYPGAQNLADWTGLLRPEFLGFASSGLVDGVVNHTFAEVKIHCSDGILAVRHGLLTGSTVEPQTDAREPRGPFYLIDMDYYDATEGELEIRQIISKMRAYSDVMYPFFRWALMEKLYSYLEPSHGR